MHQRILLTACEAGPVNFHLVDEHSKAWRGRRDVHIPIVCYRQIRTCQSLLDSKHFCAWHATGQKGSALFKQTLLLESTW